MQKITPHLWFDKEAKEAAELYTSLLDGKITNVTTLHNTPGGDADTVSFELSGQSFMAISAGPLFKFNPSISFHVKRKTEDEVNKLWKELIDGGKALMELGGYPFSKRYGWLQDKYGLSWQIIYVGDPPAGGEIKQKITPVIMYVGDVCGKAEEAVKFYTTTFKEAKIDFAQHYGKDEEPNKEGSLKYASFTLFGQEFGAMDGAGPHQFKFNEAISFIVKCEDQDEIDYYWEKLSSVPESEQCGWLKDKFGVSWQIVPSDMEKMMAKGTPEQMTRVTKAFLKMKKFIVSDLQKAFEGK